jgi:hypothetical protein
MSNVIDLNSRRTARARGGDDHFGVCPTCKKNDGYINVGKGHWFYCEEHRVCWFVGSNLMSSWRDQTEDEQRRTYEDLGFGNFDHIDCKDAA